MSSVLLQGVGNLPYFGVYLVACVLAVSRWDKHPTTSVLVVTAAGIAVLARVAAFALPMVLARSDSGGGSLMWAVYALNGLVSTVGLGCLVAAVFADRSSRSDSPTPTFR